MSEAAAPAARGMALWRYRRRFSIDGRRCEVKIYSRSSGLDSRLLVEGETVASDFTPAMGPGSVRNHRLAAPLPDGRQIEVEAGYINLANVGIAVRLDGALVHESHPGRTIAYPDKYREQVASSGSFSELMNKGAKDDGIDLAAWKRNRVPLAVDISLGLLFFIVAKITDLSTAALVGAAVGLALVVAQRFVKVDLIGGLALFGVLMLLISAGLAIAFQDDMAVKMRTTIVGSISATFFIVDGLLGGKRLGRAFARYMPYNDLDPGRLAMGVGLIGLVMAGLNYGVAVVASTSTWLLYSTFLDLPLAMGLFLLVIHVARDKRPRAAQAQTSVQA